MVLYNCTLPFHVGLIMQTADQRWFSFVHTSKECKWCLKMLGGWSLMSSSCNASIHWFCQHQQREGGVECKWCSVGDLISSLCGRYEETLDTVEKRQNKCSQCKSANVGWVSWCHPRFAAHQWMHSCKGTPEVKPHFLKNCKFTFLAVCIFTPNMLTSTCIKAHQRSWKENPPLEIFRISLQNVSLSSWVASSWKLLE